MVLNACQPNDSYVVNMAIEEKSSIQQRAGQSGRNLVAREEDLPERARQAIVEQQADSEKLIGWFQLAVVATFGTLYAISPKTFSEQAEFEPIPWVLGLYAGFTLLRLWLAYHHSLPKWFLALSVVSDMALLMVTIWSFHLQYMQPAAFYLKSPTLLYVFIFIALRTLRFEAAYVILAGIVAAGGWLAMVAYATVLQPDDMAITRDYVYYLTSNSVLLGAEFDKVISILVVTIILAVAITRARRLLVRAVSESMAASELSRFFDPEVAERIRGSEDQVEAGQGEHRAGTIVNFDIRGFTSLSNDVSADELMSILAEYQARVGPLIRKYNGSIDKFLGDGIMATFGVTEPSPSYAADALRAISEIMEDTAAWRREREASGKPAPMVCAAAASGRVVFGAVGDGDRLEYTVIGDAVNLSAKLEKHNKDLKSRALSDMETIELARTQGYPDGVAFDIRPKSAVAGTGSPMDIAILAV